MAIYSGITLYSNGYYPLVNVSSFPGLPYLSPSAPGAGPSTCAALATRRGPWPGPDRNLASFATGRPNVDGLIVVGFWEMSGKCMGNVTEMPNWCLTYMSLQLCLCRVLLAFKRIQSPVECKVDRVFEALRTLLPYFEKSRCANEPRFPMVSPWCFRETAVEPFLDDVPTQNAKQKTKTHQPWPGIQVH